MTVDHAVKQAAVVEPGLRPVAGISSNRDFMKLWAGETVSLVGTQITQFALPLVAILTLQASVFQVGVLAACRNVPVVLVSLFAGVWLDRCRRRPVLIACSLANAFLIGLIPVASVLGLLSMNLLYLVCVLSGAVSVTFDVGVLSYVPSLVGRQHLADSNSRMQSSMSFAMVAGPGIAGVVEDSDADHRITCMARQGAPSSASSPRVASLSSFVGQIYAGGGVRSAIGNRSGIDLGRVAVCVHEEATLLFRRLEPACDAHSE